MSVVRFLAIPATLYLTYQITKAAYKQYKFRNVPELQANKLRFNTQFSQDKQQLIKEARQYMSKHEGVQMIKTLRSEQFYQEQLKAQIHEKQKQIKSSLSAEERAALEQQIQQLNKAYQSIHPILIDQNEFRQK